MTYEQVRQFCVRWGNMAPDTKGSVADIVAAMADTFTYPQRGLLLVLATHIDEQHAFSASE